MNIFGDRTECPLKNPGAPQHQSADPAAKSSLAGDASPSNPDVLRTVYSALLKTRMLEEQVLSLLRAGKDTRNSRADSRRRSHRSRRLASDCSPETAFRRHSPSSRRTSFAAHR